MYNYPQSDIELIDNLLDLLSKDSEQKLPKNLSLQDKRFFVDAYILIRSCGDVNENILKLQDRLLFKENDSKIFDLSNVKFRKNIANINGNFAFVPVDLAIVFSNNLLTNSNPLDYCVDNNIIKYGGLQIKEELSKIFIENGQVLSYIMPYIVNGYNLACKSVAKILMPVISIDMSAEFKNTLICNLQNVFKYAKENNLKTISVNLCFPSCYDYKLVSNIVVEECKKLNKQNKLKARLIFINNQTQ